MKGVLALFTKGWVITLILIVLFAALIWYAGPLIGIAGFSPLQSGSLRVALIVALFLLWLLAFLIHVVAFTVAQRRVARAMMESGDREPPEPTAGEQETAALDQRFQEAVQTLAGGIGPSKVDLYRLPWYVVIGPPGSGKTTALRNSGLDMPLEQRFGDQAFRGVGGTRDCEWWFTSEAVLLDTAGRYFTQDSDHETDRTGWLHFLKLIKQYRRRKPINGVLVVLSVTDLVQADEQERATHALAIHLRLKELKTHLGMDVPVYFVLTKCDLLPGFMEFFSDLDSTGRQQVWGTTFASATDAISTASTQFPTEFDALSERLGSQLPQRLQTEHDPARRALMYRFVLEYTGLRGPVVTFLEELLGGGQSRVSINLRGVYFASGTQEGRPVDRLLGSVVRDFGLSPEALPSYSGHGRSYFITDLLRRVVFPEYQLAGSDTRLERVLTKRQRVLYGGVAGLLALVGLIWWGSFNANKAYLQLIAEDVSGYPTWTASRTAGEADLVAMLPVLDASRETIRLSKDEAVPRYRSLGLSAASPMKSATRRTYDRLLQEHLTPRLKRQLERQLRNSQGDDEFAFFALRIYLWFRNPERMDRGLVQFWFVSHWAQSFQGTPDQLQVLEEHLHHLLNIGIEPQRLQGTLIAGVRSQLAQSSAAELHYRMLKRRQLSSDRNPMKLSQILGPQGNRVFVQGNGQPVDAVIPTLFTKNGFTTLLLPSLADLPRFFIEYREAMGSEQKGPRERLEDAGRSLMNLYFADYIQAWDGPLQDMHLVPLIGLQKATEVAGLLSADQSPMSRLLETVAHNTALSQLSVPAEKDKPSLLAQATEKLQIPQTGGQKLELIQALMTGRRVGAQGGAQPSTAVERHFEPLIRLMTPSRVGTAPISSVQGQVGKLYEHLAIGGLTTPQTPGAVSQSAATPSQQLEAEARLQPQPVRRWLLSLAASVGDLKRSEHFHRLNEILSQVLSPHCQQLMGGGYPFYPSSQDDITLQDFGNLFGPQGLLAKSFDEYLRPLVDTSGGSWRWKDNALGRGVGAQTLLEFQRAARIRSAFFGQRGEMPQAGFTLTPTYLDPNLVQARLAVDGQVFNYRHGPQQAAAGKWPGRESGTGARIDLIGPGGAASSLNAEGPWAFFRLIDKGRVVRSSPDRFSLTFEVGQYSVRYEIRASSANNPFTFGDVRAFRCPDGIR